MAIHGVSKSVVTQASEQGIFIFTAFKRFLDANKTGIFINGWVVRSLLKRNLQRYCCFLLLNGDILSSPVVSSAILYNTRLTTTLQTCYTPRDVKFSDHVAVSAAVIELDGVHESSLERIKSVCSHNHSTYVMPFKAIEMTRTNAVVGTTVDTAPNSVAENQIRPLVRYGLPFPWRII